MWPLAVNLSCLFGGFNGALCDLLRHLHRLSTGVLIAPGVRDRRQTKLRWQNTEVNDEITALNFHPSRDNLLLSGADDGVVCIFDTEVQEEQDSLLQAVNHGPIHKAGFLGSTDLYALSSDQNLALHPLTVDDVDVEADETPAPEQLGDLRPAVPCEYVIDILQSGQDHVVACGSHSYSRVDLVKLDRGTGLRLDRRIVLEGAHGEEIVRSVYVDDENGTIFTAGEDGRVAAFRPGDSAPPVTPAKAKAKKASDARYKPY
ncbi:hypothetical protein A1O7_04081 [Cladophialophora yegresii CBS 114405]|uniref:Uncharacterized protein n=1 Tax=Cladophialophora yegresii CBS 114405 TaxID=1182544 RepID=W9VW95_9EURO|nr:uncharacterized protein A1O7_04081 [Cladophialophora yegresii CBS 114405]EXJ59933.1 hypothetical protein A1O7_04081 [Cladophialophora yegresii CBS 114405]